MTRSRSTTFLAGLTVVLLTAVLAGCGGGDDPPAPPKTANGQAATLGVGTTDLGKILVDSKARTLYLFKRDSDGRSTCAGACASEWPPLRASGTPTVGSGANGDLLAITKRTDGAPQLSYRGHPLYLYQRDETPGDTNGQGVTAFGGSWYALSPTGIQVSKPQDAGGGSSSGGVGGY